MNDSEAIALVESVAELTRAALAAAESDHWETLPALLQRRGDALAAMRRAIPDLDQAPPAARDEIENLRQLDAALQATARAGRRQAREDAGRRVGPDPYRVPGFETATLLSRRA